MKLFSVVITIQHTERSGSFLLIFARLTGDALLSSSLYKHVLCLMLKLPKIAQFNVYV